MKFSPTKIAAIVLVLILVPGTAKWWKRISYESKVSKRVDATRHSLPHSDQPGFMQTGIELQGHLLKSRFRTSHAFDATPELTAAMTKAARDSVCNDADFREMLEHGYTFEHTFDRTPEVGGLPGTGIPLQVATTAADCPGVSVKK